MADVSVEFGAQDTGLQKTLQTIQQQMTSLQGEVDSGTLSFQEISQKMREIKQAESIFTKLGGEISQAAKSAKEFEDQIRRAEAVTKSNRTALEVYSDEVDQLGKLLDSGLISQKTYASAIEKAEAALKAATPQTEEAKRANEALEASLKKAEAETKALAQEQARAEAITKANRTATQIYNDEVEELQKHLSAGRISTETFANAVAKADARLAAANPQVQELGKEIKIAGDKADGAAGIFDASFAKISAAFTVGNIAAQAFEKIIQTAFDIARAAAQGFSDALDLGGRLNELSARTGEAAGKLLVLETAFKNSGISADQVGVAINKLQNFMADATAGGEKQTSAMNNLGISMSELNGKTPTQQMQVFADKISAIKDPTDRAAVASEIFGDKLGGKLLPVLTDFSGNLDDARTKVGSLEQVMDENAATFDAAGETIDAVKGKMAAFAAGIMSETLPALKDLGREMEAVDAAGLGQQIGRQLNPALTAAADAAKIVTILFDRMGEATAGVASEITKTQEGSNLLVPALVALQNQLNPAIGASNQFKAVLKLMGEESVSATDAQKNTASAIKATGEAAVEAKPKLDALPGAGEALVNEFAKVPEAISSSLPMIGEFKANLDGAAPSITGIADGALAVKNDFSEISSLTAQLPGQTETYNQTIGGVNEQLRLQDELYKKIIPEIQAAGLATDNTSKSAGKVTENLIGASVEAQTVKGLMDEIANAKMEASPERLKERTKDARKELKDMADFIGDDLSQMPLDDIIDKLGLDSSKLKTTDEKLRAVEGAVKDIGGADPADITPDVDLVGVNDQLEKVKGYLAGIEKDKADATPKIDQESIKNQVATSSETIKKDLEKIKAEVKVKPKLDKEALKEEVDMAFASSKGTQHLSNIDKLVETIKGFVEKIEGKLPLQALAY